MTERQAASDRKQLSGYGLGTAIAGIGININQTDFRRRRPSRFLRQITGQSFDVVDCP